MDIMVYGLCPSEGKTMELILYIILGLVVTFMIALGLNGVILHNLKEDGAHICSDSFSALVEEFRKLPTTLCSKNPFKEDRRSVYPSHRISHDRVQFRPVIERDSSVRHRHSRA